mmetsp:Transcript_9055/g.37010  ORF Transcript_9055/g.37010 Transcript_9055/m.37010 type:complete len:242 (+) Transcript_9055:1007-1732(+)
MRRGLHRDGTERFTGWRGANAAAAADDVPGRPAAHPAQRAIRQQIRIFPRRRHRARGDGHGGSGEAPLQGFQGEGREGGAGDAPRALAGRRALAAVQVQPLRHGVRHVVPRDAHEQAAPHGGVGVPPQHAIPRRRVVLPGQLEGRRQLLHQGAHRRGARVAGARRVPRAARGRGVSGPRTPRGQEDEVHPRGSHRREGGSEVAGQRRGGCLARAGARRGHAVVAHRQGRRRAPQVHQAPRR